MIASRRAAATPFSMVDRITLALLALALLATGFSGRAGVQVMDRAMAARLFPLHRHGVPGEDAWIAEHGTWEGFVPSHYHAPLTQLDPQPGPDEVQAASSLSGAVHCATADVGVGVPAARPGPLPTDLPAPADALVPVPVLPPR